MDLIISKALTVACALGLSGSDLPHNYVAGKFIQLQDNGAWSWFTDERAIINKDILIVGSVRAVAGFKNSAEKTWGNIEIVTYNLSTGAKQHSVLHTHFEQDDHDSPSLLALPEGDYVAAYAKHDQERKFYVRRSSDGITWSDAIEVVTPGVDRTPFGDGNSDNVTYPNLFRTPSGRLFDFYRGYSHDPNYAVSDDDGATWKYGGHLLKGRDGYGPYLKYAMAEDGAIHFVATEDHPRNYDTSIYHGIIRNGILYRSDRSEVGPISQDTGVSASVEDLTRVFNGDPDNVPWMSDLGLDGQGNPYLIFTVQKDGRGRPRGEGGFDHRFHYARWNGKEWEEHEIAFAGSRLYAGEDDYTGLAALDPNDPSVVYISTDADPVTGYPLVSATDCQRHREIFRGKTVNHGMSWRWEPITANSSVDNIRPVIPKGDTGRTSLVWLRGTYRSNRGEWTTAVVASILSP